MKTKYLVVITIIFILILAQIFFFRAVTREIREENYVWFEDGIYIECEETSEGLSCTLPDGKELVIQKKYTTYLEEKNGN